MTTTGFVRKTDDLGRIVIPKEIRQKLHIREGDALELFLDDRHIVCRKYQPFNSITPLDDLINDLAHILSTCTFPSDEAYLTEALQLLQQVKFTLQSTITFTD